LEEIKSDQFFSETWQVQKASLHENPVLGSVTIVSLRIYQSKRYSFTNICFNVNAIVL